MRVPVYIVCAALIVAVNSEENFYGRENTLQQQQQGGLVSDEQETLGYLLPRLMAKYRINRQWAALQPYYINDIDSNNIDNRIALSQEGRSKRGNIRPSLSITNSLDVLRNRLLLEMSRKKAQEDASRNRNLLCQIGKRGALFDTKRKCGDVADPNTDKFLDDKYMND